MYQYRILVTENKKVVVDGEDNIGCIILSQSDGLYLDWNDNTFKNYNNINKLTKKVEQINKDMIPGLYQVGIPLSLFNDGIYEVYIIADEYNFRKSTEIVVMNGKLYREYVSQILDESNTKNTQILSLLHENFTVTNTKYDSETNVLKECTVSIYEDPECIKKINEYDMVCSPLDKGIFSYWTQIKKG